MINRQNSVFSAGISWASQELLQHRSEVGTQGPPTCIQRSSPQEERHATGELITACASIIAFVSQRERYVYYTRMR